MGSYRRLPLQRYFRSLAKCGISLTVDTLIHNIFFALGALLFCGFWFERLLQFLKMPSLVGYILAGFILGPNVCNLVPHKMAPALGTINEVALGLLALRIGAEFTLDKVRKAGMKLLSVMVIQALLTLGLLSTIFYITGLFNLSAALLLGALATVSTLSIAERTAKEPDCKGNSIAAISGMVGLEEIFSILLFSIIFTMAGLWQSEGIEAIAGLIPGCAREILFSFILAAFSAWLINYRWQEEQEEKGILVKALGVFLLTYAVVRIYHLSIPLTFLFLGLVFVNISKVEELIDKNTLQNIEILLLTLFFVFAGLGIKLNKFLGMVTLVISIIFILFRTVSILLGTYLCSLLLGVAPEIRKSLGRSFLPQARVVVGLALLIKYTPQMHKIASPIMTSGAFLSLIVNIALISVLFNEIFGPVLIRRALRKVSQESRNDEDKGDSIEEAVILDASS
ncbi:cation:proton antiporter [Candidatus Riflebacteria bacterium]